MKARIISLLLAVIMVIVCIPYGAFASENAEMPKDSSVSSGPCGTGLTWSLENGTLTISGTGGAFDFTTAEGAPWHDRVSEITKFIVEQGVTIVPSEACFGCTALTEISIANSVTAIGSDAFGGCASLRSVKMPDSVSVLGMYAFFGCESLTTVSLGIGVNGLGYTVFGNTPSLTEINVDSRNTYITSLNGIVYNKDMSKLLYRPQANGETLIVPAGVLGIAEGACMYDFSGFDTVSPIKEIRFKGDAPGFGNGCFTGITANAYYPDNNDTWTESRMSGCSGNLTWIPYEAESVKTDISECDISLSFDSAQWTGSPIRPTVTVSYNGVTLKEYTHYEVSYSDNRNVGPASVTVTGIWLYSGSYTKHFTIEKADQTLELSIDFNEMEVNDRTQLRAIGTRGAAYLTCVSNKPDVASIDSNRYITALSPGEAVITVTSAGNDNYNELSKSITVVVSEKAPGPYDISTCNVKMLNGNMTYTGRRCEAAFTVSRRYKTLVKNKDYTIEYQNCVNAGTATAVITGIGDYYGEVSYDYKILKAGQDVNASISPKSILLWETAQITVEGYGAFTYTSNDTDIATVDENGLVTGVGIGTVYIYVTASGDENHNSSERAVVLKVSAPVVDGLVSIADCVCTLDTVKYVYDGSAKEPTATVTYGDAALEEGKDYIILYDNNKNAGTATAYIVGINSYTGSSGPLEFRIERAEQTILIDPVSPIIIKVGESVTINASGVGNIVFHTAIENDVLDIGYETGIVTGLNPGSVEVYVSAGGDSNHQPGYSSVSVQVVPDEDSSDPYADIDNIYVLPEELSVLGKEAFAGNTLLQAVYAPANAVLSEIRSGAFRNCVNLTKVELPASVSSISDDAFDGCAGLSLTVANDYCAGFAEDHDIPYVRK